MEDMPEGDVWMSYAQSVKDYLMSSISFVCQYFRSSFINIILLFWEFYHICAHLFFIFHDTEVHDVKVINKNKE